MSLNENEVYPGILENLRTPEGDGKELDIDTSKLVERTGKVCCNCINSDNNYTRCGNVEVRCVSLESDKKGFLNRALDTCPSYE